MFSDNEHLKFIEKCKNEKLDIVVTSVVETLGSTYAKAGNIMLVNSNEIGRASCRERVSSPV